MAGRPWHKQELETLARLVQEGKSALEASRELRRLGYDRSAAAVSHQVGRGLVDGATGPTHAWTDAEIDLVRLGIARGLTTQEIAAELQAAGHPRTVAAVANVRQRYTFDPPAPRPAPEPRVQATPAAPGDLRAAIWAQARKGAPPLLDLARDLGIPASEALEAVKALQAAGKNIRIDGPDLLVLADGPQPGGKGHAIDLSGHTDGTVLRVGFLGDSHLCSKQARLDVNEALFDLFEAAGIETVYHTGNWIDGECSFNKGDLLTHGMTRQVDYFIDNWPHRPGITTYIVDGDDHEGWYAQREGIAIGEYMEGRAREAGRADLISIGYLEADVKVKTARGENVLRVMHPGGGSAYAFSYTAQKIVESLQGGEKPGAILLGHYHKFDLCYPRGVWALQTGTTQDQTRFMRKKKLEAHVGGGILEVRFGAGGEILRFAADFLPFYDRGFYSANFGPY